MVFYPPIVLSDAERGSMKAWIEANAAGNFFQDANMRGNRVTTRYTDAAQFNFPEVVYEIRARVSDVLGFGLEPTPAFKDGMVASYASPGDTCYSHKDPVWHGGFYTVHCNVILSAPEEGGELIVEGKQYNMPEGRFICYPVSEVMHGTLLVKGAKPRLMWVFGFCVTPKQYLETVRKYQ
jgi:hypothetical protein